MKNINIALIGLGHWGKNYYRIFENFDGVTVKKICDLNKNNKFNNQNNFTTNIDDIINDKSISAAIISTKASSHYALALKSIKSGKHILVEKPLTLNLNEAKKLNKLANRYKKILMVGHTFLYNSGIRKLKKIIESNIIGKIYYISCRRTHLGLIRDDVDAVWDLAPHDISILNYILDGTPKSGKIKSIVQLKKNRSDAAFLDLKYLKNIHANIHVSWLDSNKTRTIEIIGSKAKVIFDDLNLLEPIKIFKKGISTEKNGYKGNIYYLRDGNILAPKINVKEPLLEMCTNFIDSIKFKKKPLSDFKVGYESIKILKNLKKTY